MAPSVTFYGQPFADDESAGSALEAILDDEGLGELTIVVAWAKYRGLLRLRDKFKEFRDRGGTIRVVVGIDEGGATRPGLLGVLRMADEAFVFHDPGGGTFHPKVYLGEGEAKAVLLVGSSNLTPGGLFLNVEASTATLFDLPDEAGDLALLGARRFIARLIEDADACKRLTEGVVDGLYADKRYRIAGHERRRTPTVSRPQGADPEDIDESGSGIDSEEGGPLFSPSRQRRSSVPPLTQADRDELASLEIDEPEPVALASATPETPMPPAPAPATPETPTPTPPAPAVAPAAPPAVTEVWTKEMKRSDAQQVSTGSNPTGVLRLTQEQHEINHLTWFRQTMFRPPVVWSQSTDRQGNPIEQAGVPFDVRIEGQARGTVVLTVDHAPHRESGQGNVPTVIHWGSLAAELRANDYSGKTLTLERLSGGKYRLTIG